MPTAAFIALGTNLGDRPQNLRDALAGLRPLAFDPGADLPTSSVWSTEPRLDLDQPDFLNMVVALLTPLPPRALLLALLAVEARLGRTRALDRPKGPRLIDLDLLLYGDLILHDPDLLLPHPGLPDRRFVLAPLAELAPDLRHPLTGQTVRAMLAACPDTGQVQPLLHDVWNLKLAE